MAVLTTQIGWRRLCRQCCHRLIQSRHALLFRTKAAHGHCALIRLAHADRQNHRHFGDRMLAPVMALTSRILALRTVPAGESVGYGASWVAPRESRIATVALGYGDGYPRTLPSGTPVLTAAGLAPLVGRVSMDSLTIDITDLPSVGLGDRVTLCGKGLPVDQLAAALGTIGYELLTLLGPRVPRVVEGPAHG